MQELVDWLREDTSIHPVLIAGIAQFQLVHIHPFIDGNGRTSRLLSTLSLYRSGYDFKRLFTISEFYDRDRSIRSDVIARANGLNARQAGALDQLFSRGRLTLTELEQSFPTINRRTLQRDLKLLLNKGLLHEVGAGPTDPNRHYLPATSSDTSYDKL